MATPFNTSTINGVPVLDPPPNCRTLTNVFTACSGAARWGIGRFLIYRSDYTNLLNANAPVQLIMNGGPDTTNNVLSIYCTLAGCRPFSTITTNGNPVTGDNVGNSPNDVVEAVLFDQRYAMFQPVNKAYNVQVESFAYTSGVPNFYSETLNSGSQWTWAGMLTDLGVPSLPTNPSWNPRNADYNGVPFARIIDSIASKLFLVVGYNFQSSLSSNGNLSFNTPNVENSFNAALFNLSNNAWISGGVGERNPYRLPGHYNVIFKTVGVSDPYQNRVYVSSQTNANNPSGANTVPINIGDYIGITPSGGGSPSNSTELNTVAADIATRAGVFQSVPIGEIQYAGIWPFQLDGQVRGIQWVSGPSGATTTIRYNNDRDFSPGDEALRAMEFASNQLIVGPNAINASADPSNSRFIYPNKQFFTVVQVSQVGGSAGNSTTQCSFTYSAASLDGSINYGTNIAVSGGRPVNVFTIAGTIGLLYLNGSGNYELLWVNESWQQTSCP